MTYRTIRQKAHAQFKRATGHICLCGDLITKRNLRYYIDEFGECKPICKECYEVIKEVIK